ncbi:MAG: DUF2927 domain-containing protein [Pseudomonadota bacterium]
MRTPVRCIAALGIFALAACTPVRDADYWSSYEDRQLARGNLRVERAPSDIEYSNEDLIRNFREIMFRREYVRTSRGFVRGRAPRDLSKPGGPIRFSLGEGVTDADRVLIEDMIDRLRRVTRLEFVESDDEPQLRVEILDKAGREALGHELMRLPRWRFAGRHLLKGFPGVVCANYESRSRETSGEDKSIVLIPAEVSGTLRRACIEEEIGQAFGPSADYDEARPSIFNDDQEFALLTEHDEWLFRILYDERLRNGMTEQVAMPIVRRIIAELRPEG